MSQQIATIYAVLRQKEKQVVNFEDTPLRLMRGVAVNPSPATHAILTVLEAGETVRKTPFGNKTVYSVKHILQQ